MCKKARKSSSRSHMFVFDLFYSFGAKYSHFWEGMEGECVCGGGSFQGEGAVFQNSKIIYVASPRAKQRIFRKEKSFWLWRVVFTVVSLTSAKEENIFTVEYDPSYEFISENSRVLWVIRGLKSIFVGCVDRPCEIFGGWVDPPPTF